jgi:broad specificity polyphosphatase/5'/3'-nucleotidase SurE
VTADSSPFILPWFNTLRTLHPTWDIQVVIPDSQKSWISKAFHIAETITATFYNPKTGATSAKQQSSEDWLLLNGLNVPSALLTGRDTVHVYEYRTSSCLWGKRF